MWRDQWKAFIKEGVLQWSLEKKAKVLPSSWGISGRTHTRAERTSINDLAMACGSGGWSTICRDGHEIGLVSQAGHHVVKCPVLQGKELVLGNIGPIKDL